MFKTRVKTSFVSKDNYYILNSVVFFDRVHGFMVDELKVTDKTGNEIKDIHIVDHARDVSCFSANELINGRSYA